MRKDDQIPELWSFELLENFKTILHITSFSDYIKVVELFDFHNQMCMNTCSGLLSFPRGIWTLEVLNLFRLE